MSNQESDRELLELAAKAAGMQGHFVEKFPEDGAPCYSCGIGNAGRIIPLWNPLTDDGDALRLAVKLKIDIEFWADHTVIADRCVESEVVEPARDLLAATRRAIVRAAAEIGKAA